MDYTVSLAGNPNVGKTSLYNRITHSFEHVGNWHGVTVDKVDKTFDYGGHKINLVDLPGLYSLSVYSPEEGITRDFVLNGKSDVVICVCEVNNLPRNLYLAVQLLELKLSVVLVVNMIDELDKQGKILDVKKLENNLGIPVVAMSAKYRTDVDALMGAVLGKIESDKMSAVKLNYLEELPIRNVQAEIRTKAESAGLPADWAALKTLEQDTFVLEKLGINERDAERITEGDTQALVAKARYEFIDEVTKDVITEKNGTKKRKTRRAEIAGAYGKLDGILLNKYAALPVFLLIMCAVFFITFGPVGGFFGELTDKAFDKFLYAPITAFLTSAGAADWIVRLIGDGIISGAVGVLKFLPQVVLLFFFLALMEDSGYISRVAFATDGLFGKIGLSGRSVFTMLMGFGCSATAVLTARGLEDETMRKKTVIITPFMSCSARLPVYTVIAGAFFASGKFLVIFGLYVLGAVVALSVAAISEKIKPMKSGKRSFIMEMPPYRFPTLERILQIIGHNAKVYLIKVGTIIFGLNIIVWLLSNFSLVGGFSASPDNSILATLGGLIAPVFKPLGFGNWKAVTALLGGLVAKEVVISSIQSLGGVAAVFTGEYAALNALTFAVFTLLYVPCIATVSAQLKEIGWKWTALGCCIQLATAYFVAFVVRMIGLGFVLNKGLATGIAAVVAVIAAAVFVTVCTIKSREKCNGKCCSCSSYCKKV